jgi:hypothetical protein
MWEAFSICALVGVVERTRVGPRSSHETHGVEWGFETGDKSHLGPPLRQGRPLSITSLHLASTLANMIRFIYNFLYKENPNGNYERRREPRGNT